MTSETLVLRDDGARPSIPSTRSRSLPVGRIRSSRPASPSTTIRRLDHVAVVVRDTDDALRWFGDRLGLRVASSEEIFDAGNAYVQLVQPLDPESDLSAWLDENGEGLHHICFGVDDVPASLRALAEADGEPVLGSGRGRVSGFVNGGGRRVRVECTEFDYGDDVEQTPGWIA